jgi:hypothetical protein
MQYLIQSTREELSEWWNRPKETDHEFLSERRLKRDAKRVSKFLFSPPPPSPSEETQPSFSLQSPPSFQLYQIPRRNGLFNPPPLFHASPIPPPWGEVDQGEIPPVWQTAGTSFEIGPEGISQDMDVLCTICLEEFVPEQLVNRLPCLHMFHDCCIKSWLEIGSLTCPSCRAFVLEEN